MVCAVLLLLLLLLLSLLLVVAVLVVAAIFVIVAPCSVKIFFRSAANIAHLLLSGRTV